MFVSLPHINSFLLRLRGLLNGLKFLFFITLISCASFNEPCSVDGEHGLSFSGDDSNTLFGVFDSNLDPTCVHSRASISEDSVSEFESNKTWSLDYGVFKLSDGLVSCSLRLRDRTEIDQSSSSGDDVEIYPQVLDFGRKYRYFPSVAFLSIANRFASRVLNVYEPFSTDSQFYPCNFSRYASVGPGETISICFVFSPTSLGSISARLVLQTSEGGFVIEAKGLSVESPNGNNLSISFRETLFVHEITAWLSVSIAHDSVDTEAICSFRDSPGTETMSVEPKGAFCVKMSRSDAVLVVPLKAEIDVSELYDDDDGVAVSLRNDAPYLLSADTKPLHMESLLLYPETDNTELAVASCDDSEHGKCKIVAATNDSGSPEIEVEIVQMSSYKHRGTISLDFMSPLQAMKKGKGKGKGKGGIMEFNTVAVIAFLALLVFGFSVYASNSSSVGPAGESETRTEEERKSKKKKKKRNKKKKKKEEEEAESESGSGNSSPTYDIWADHFSTIRSQMDSDSDSFFLHTPHSLFSDIPTT